MSRFIYFRRFALSHVLRFGAAALLATSPGCFEEASGPFDPRGDEVALYGEWDIDAQNPAVVTTACADANVESVELVFFSLDESESYTDATFRFPCAWGVYDSVDPVLRQGIYRYEWRFYAPGASEPIVTDAVRYVMDARGVTSFDLQAVNFNSAGSTARVVARAGERGAVVELP